MQNSIEFSPSSTQFYDDLIKSIEEPQPACLILVRINVSHTSSDLAIPNTDFIKSPEDLAEGIMHIVHKRLSSNLRKYDICSRVEQDAFAVVLKTLAEEEELNSRINNLVDILKEPYKFQNTETTISIEVGSAFRRLGEKPSTLLKRADESYRTVY